MSLQEYVEIWSPHCVYMNAQIEAGKEETPHVQAYVSLKKNHRLAALKKKDPHAHFEVVKVDNGASSYCLKEDTRLEGPIEFGTRPLAR